MRQYFTKLRLYRVSDQNYHFLMLEWTADSLGDLDRQLTAFEMGLKVAGGGRLLLENVGVGVPTADAAEWFKVGDPNMLIEIQYFLGIKRDRRHRPIAPIKTEEQIEEEKPNGGE